MNDRLTKELRELSLNLEQSNERNKNKGKLSATQNDPIIQAKEKELEEAQNQLVSYQKEIATLKAKLEAKTGYDK